MDNSALKESIIKKVEDINDPRLLAYLDKLIDIENSTKVYYMSDEEKKMVNEGWEAYKKGDYINGDDADREIDEWLKNNLV
ncbi:MAG: hypothetical protein M0D57_15560 [Sphingobacteriales bacterium JAD_PAG50586_3]|nr:MAG: hypothetical protein M0D57_15560 [Sphingobacteriales bacterium JAD_PAG50586_3]